LGWREHPLHADKAKSAKISKDDVFMISKSSNARINAAARIHPRLKDRRMMKMIQSPLALNELLDAV
jgi:hypothetical protein